MRNPKLRIYWRNGRAWADSRNCAHVRGKAAPVARANGPHIVARTAGGGRTRSPTRDGKWG